MRTLQLFLKGAPWDDQQMKQIDQDRVVQIASDADGMLTVDGSDFAKKGTHSAGVHRQYCGSKGKVDNCQAGVFYGKDGGKRPPGWCHPYRLFRSLPCCRRIRAVGRRDVDGGSQGPGAHVGQVLPCR